MKDCQQTDHQLLSVSETCTDSDTIEKSFVINCYQMQSVYWIDCFSGNWMYPNLV